MSQDGPDRTDPNVTTPRERPEPSFFETIRNALIGATFTALGVVGAWVWQIDRQVAVMHSDAQHCATKEELIGFIATQTEINKKVDVLFDVVVMRSHP